MSRLGRAVLAAAGCGGGDDAPAPVRPPAKQNPCSPRMTAAAGAGAHARPVSAEPQLVTCLYTAADGVFRATVDTLPQAWFRWERAQVERTQTASDWSHIPVAAGRSLE